jgi:hypothetical protein
MAVTSERGGKHMVQASSMCLMDLTAQTAQYRGEVACTLGRYTIFWDILIPLYQSKGCPTMSNKALNDRQVNKEQTNKKNNSLHLE